MAVQRSLILALALSLLSGALAPSGAAAGGFYLADRGVRPLGRGGAYVAGVDDPHALWYNPAGLSWSGDQLLLDASLTLFETTYTRIDGGGNTLPTVSGHHAYLPIPTVAGSFSVDELPNFTFGLGAMAPNSALMDWPQSLDVDGVEYPAPQRYSLLSLEGSLLASVILAGAWRPIKELSIGLATHLLFGNFDARVALSACDGVICSFPEDPEYDGIAQLSLPTFFPFFVLGGVVDLDVVRIGASVSTPYNLEGSALIQVRPPSAAAFSGAEVVNRRPGCNHEDPTDPCRQDTRADVQIEFPWILRLGVEVRPMPELRVEASVVYESWSVQDQVRIAPRDVWIEGALGGGLEYQVGPLNIPRYMNDTVSIRLGGAYTIDDLVTISAGGYWENGAFSDPYLTALTIDSDKLVMGGGVGINVSREFSIDVTGGYIWMASRAVRDSAVPQPNPIRPPANEAETIYIGNGDYSMGAPYFGLGIRWRGDSGNIRGPGEEEPPAATTEEEPASEEGATPSEESAPAEESAPSDPSTPWYLRGQESGTAPSTSEEPGAEPEAPAVEEDDAEERPRQRRRRPRRRRR